LRTDAITKKSVHKEESNDEILQEVEGPGSKTTTTSNKRWKTDIGCPHCGLLTHRRITSKLCRKSPSRYREEELASVEDGADVPGPCNDEVVRRGKASETTTNNNNDNNEMTTRTRDAQVADFILTGAQQVNDVQ
jgi:adenine-specific DNA methylase